MWSPLKGSSFDLCDSSMSAAVQELYAGLPEALSVKCSALSEPTLVLDAEPEAPAFVLSCSSGLPSEHQRTYELKLCSPDSHERPDYVGQMPGPTLVELLSRESAGTVVLAGSEEAQAGSSAEQEYLSWEREDAEAAKHPRSVPEEGLSCFVVASEAACWLKEAEPQLTQMGRDCLPRPLHAERAGSLQSQEENQANSQVATENPMKEAPGRKANRTVLFGKAGASSPHASPGVPLRTRECSEVEAFMAEVEVSETNTLVSLEPVTVVDDALAKERLRGEEECPRPKAATASALSVSESGGEKLSNQDQERGTAVGHILPSHQEKMNLHDNSRPALDLENHDTLPSGTVPQMSNCQLFQGGLELRCILWEEVMDTIEVVCETQEESPLDDERCLEDAAPCGKIPLLEKWTSLMNTGSPLATYRGMEQSRDSDTEQEVGKRTDHTYSCAWEGNADVEKGNAMQSYWEETQAAPCSENGQQELQVCQFSKEQNTHFETDTSHLLDAGCSSPEGHSDDDLESTLSGSDSVQRNKVQQYSFPKDRQLTSALEGSASPGEKAGNSVCFSSSCTVSTFSLPACRMPFSWDRQSCEEPLQPVESASSQRTLIGSSDTSLHGVHSSGISGVHLVNKEASLSKVSHSDGHSFPPESGMISSPGGFLDSLPKEEFSGTCVELGRRGAACLPCNEKAGPNLGCCIDKSRESQQCKVEERMVGTRTVESNKCSPTDQRINSPCSAAKHDWIILESVCLDDHVLKMRTETTNDGPEMCHPLVYTKIAGPPLERSGFEAQDSPTYKNSQKDLDGAENSSASLSSMLTGSTALSGAEVLALDPKVESEKKANDSCRNAGEILDVDTHFGPPDTNLEQGLIAVSLATVPGRTEAEKSGKGKEDNHRNRANEKPRDSGLMGETVHCSDLGRLVKDQGKESKIPAHHSDCLHSTCSWNQEVEIPEREVLKGQQHLSMISSWPARDGAAQDVTCSETKKSPSCSQNEFLGLQSNGIMIPQPAPTLVTPNDTQQNMTVSCFSNETAFKLVSDPLKREPLELKNSKPHFECVSEWNEWTDEVKTGNFCSASQSLEASPADVTEKMQSLMLFNSESASPSDQTYLHTDPSPLARANSQNSIDGASSGMFQNKKLSSLTQPAQNPGTSLSQKEDLSISLYPSVLSYPPIPRYPVLTGDEGDHHVRLLTSGNEKGSHSPRVGSGVGSRPLSKEVPRSLIGSNAVTVIGGEIVCTTPSDVNLSKKMAPSLEDHLQGGSQEAQKVDLPFGSFSNTSDSSGLSSHCLKQTAVEGVPILPEAEACPRLPFNPSERGQSNEPPCVKDTPKIVTLMEHSEDVGGHAWHSKGLLPIGSPGIHRSGVPWASPGGLSGVSPKCFGSQERHGQCTEHSREQAGIKRKSSGHSYRSGIEVPVWITRVSELGDCPEHVAKALRKEAGGCPYQSFASFDGLRGKPKGQADHLVKSRVGQPLCGPAGKPKVPAQQSFTVGRIPEGRKSKSAQTTLQASKRPKISNDSIELDCLEAGSSCLSEKNCGWTSTDSKVHLAPVFNKQIPAVGSGWDRIGNAFGSVHKTRPSLASRRPPCKVWGKSSGLIQFKAARKSTPVINSACFKSLLEVVPLPQSKRVDRASSAIWRWAPKPRASQNRLLDSVGFGRLAKDQAVLRRLSLLADRLLAPPRNPQHLKPTSHSTKFLPLTGHCRWLLSQKLLDIFSCVNLPFNSWGMNDSNCSLKTLSSPPLTLFLMESLDLCFWDLGHQAPLSVSTPRVPILFHMKVGLFPRRSPFGITSLQNQVVIGKRGATVKPWSWMLSFLFPGSHLSAAPVEEGAWTPTDSSLCAEKDRREDATAQRSTGLHTHGLQTILALSSPRCHRLWMKKQPLSARRTLATQKLIMLQFIQGLKGSNCSSSATADFSSSVPHSLGRGLSLWSQHSPSTHSFGFPPLCSSQCMWPPVTPASSSLGIRNRITPDTSTVSFHFANVQQRSGFKTPQSGCNPQFHLNQSPRLQFSAPLQCNNPHGKQVEPPLPTSLLTPCLDSEPVLSSLRLSTSEFHVRPLDGLDISLPVLPKTGSCLDKADSEKKPKKVSQIRIRKTIPKPDPNLTPMGLPRPKRLKKKEFSLEEIYTNKNYKSPPTTRCLETIFEEPKEKNGSLISVSQQKRKRILEFQDFTVPRKRRVRSRVKMLGSFTRAQKAALEGRELDVQLIQKLTDLETFFAKEEEKEQAASS